MPQNDPGLWRMIVDALEHIRMSLWQENIRPHVMATVLSFLIALLRALVSGSKFWHSLLEACLCGTLTLAVFPLLDYFGMNIYLAVSIGAAISFLGVDWLRLNLSNIFSKIIESQIEK
ncbi:phage holin, lambda family [Zymobacter sp. IVIA_5232.4 C2]|uniref:phage holin, lambda family n=1 Tax=Zymobacter sp. IVIA_5232.4 C2 TaxID=3394855 RepID=UPI0039C1E755